MGSLTIRVDHLDKTTVISGLEGRVEELDHPQRKLKIIENEKHSLDDLKNEKSLKYVKNEKCTLKDLEFNSKTYYSKKQKQKMN